MMSVNIIYLYFSNYTRPHYFPKDFKMSDLPFCYSDRLHWIAHVSFCSLVIYFILSITYLYRYFQLNRFYSPLVVVVRKMIIDVAYFFIILIIVIYGYGVMQNLLLYPGAYHQNFAQWTVWLLQKIFRKGFFHIFGELYDDEIGVTGFGGMDWGCENPFDPDAQHRPDSLCPSSGWLSLLLMAGYVLTVGIITNKNYRIHICYIVYNMLSHPRIFFTVSPIFFIPHNLFFTSNFEIYKQNFENTVKLYTCNI